MKASRQPDKNNHRPGVLHKIELSAILTVIGVVLLFSTAIFVTLLAPRYVDPTWTSPSSAYQEQMYEISDPNYYISTSGTGKTLLQAVYHLKAHVTLLAFQESETLKIIAPKHLTRYITQKNDPTLKLTSDLLLLRQPEKSLAFDAATRADKLSAELEEAWEKEHPYRQNKDQTKPTFDILELYEPHLKEAFAQASSDAIIENWVESNYVIVDEKPRKPHHIGSGVIYVNNPQEYRIAPFAYDEESGWRYDPGGEPIRTLDDLLNYDIGFRSRAELIAMGEHIYAIEGCWYCHTDQTRTLVQDVVLNGSDSFPAPPSSANEYIYQKITFPGTRRIGPDISRTGVKRPSRDWHKGHFWSPKTASKGSIMPAFHHFFDSDPRGTSENSIGIPNLQFESIYQYLMTKGTRITPPTQAWWLGKDPIQTKEIIEGQRSLLK